MTPPRAGGVRNILFIMADQLRFDYLGCAGHPFMRTPNLDALASRGVRFSRAFVNSGVCGPSRMSFYTGRYPISHGATWNRVALPVTERTLGDYLGAAGRTAHLAGKSHVVPDVESMRHLGLAPEVEKTRRAGGFEELDRYDGHHEPGPESGYGAFLRSRGYESSRPWSDFVISALDARGTVQSGWSMRNVGLPARVREEHSETAYMTDRAIEFIEREGDRPWVLHLSYVKPHWPYMAPRPYHAAYLPSECLPALRTRGELADAHPVVRAYRAHPESISLRPDECVSTVRRAYQGLISQLDAHLGRLLEVLDRRGLHSHTLVVFTSDHGDLLGDHWLGEKELFYDAVQRVPLIIRDPRAAADSTRGQVDPRFVESVDVLPTLLDALGLPVPAHRIEGRSLLPLLHGESPPWRQFVYSELDYAFRQARRALAMPAGQARAFSLRDDRWRYVHWVDQPPQLHDLHADAGEMHDLGRDATHQAVRDRFMGRLGDFLCRRKSRAGGNEAWIEANTNRHREAGVRFGEW